MRRRRRAAAATDAAAAPALRPGSKIDLDEVSGASGGRARAALAAAVERVVARVPCVARDGAARIAS